MSKITFLIIIYPPIHNVFKLPTHPLFYFTKKYRRLTRKLLHNGCLLKVHKTCIKIRKYKVSLWDCNIKRPDLLSYTPCKMKHLANLIVLLRLAKVKLIEIEFVCSPAACNLITARE